VSLTSTPYLSIVIPAHNEEKRLPPSLAKIDAFLKAQSYTYEVIVVENGSQDRTSEVTLEFAKNHPYVKLMEVHTRGKGLAVKAGMLAAHGQYRFICDTDLSMPIEEITKFLPSNHAGYDLMIGSREGKEARRIGEPEYRHMMGRILNGIVKLTAVPDFEDTQCGFKMFTARAAEDLFTVQRMHGIGFDVELIYVAKKRGYKIVDVPITWYFDADSRMKLFQDSLKILLEIWEIRQNWRKGLYEPQPIPQEQNRLTGI
jgi:dolichyl-phosphate beta-glucosyltransferase